MRTTLFHIALCLLVMLPAQYSYAVEQSASEQAMLDEVQELMRSDQPLTALRKLNQITDNPESFSPLTRADAHYAKGQLYASEDSPDYATKQYTLALALFQQTGNSEGQQSCHLELGTLRTNAGATDLALDHYRQALGFLGADSPSPLVPELQMMIGALYKRTGALAQAQTYLQPAMVTFEASKNFSSWNECALHLLNIYQLQETYNLGVKLALEGFQKNSAQDRLSDAYAFASELSQFQQLTGRAQEAIHAQERAVELAVMQQLPDRWRAHMRLGNLHAEWDNDSEAVNAYQAALNVAVGLGDLRSQQEVGRNMAAYYNRRDEYKSAYKYLNFADSLGVVLGVMDAEAIKAGAEFSNAGGQLLTLPSPAIPWYKQTAYILVLIGVWLSAMTTAWFSIRRMRRQKQLINWKLFRRTRELRQAQEDLNHYIYRSSHDLRNPLVSIQGLLRLMQNEDHSLNARKYLQMIDSSVNQMDDILINLAQALDYRKREVKVEKISLRQLRDEIEGDNNQAPGGVEIIWDIKETAAFYSDPGLIKVILQQTIENSIQFRTGSPDDYCRITLSTGDKGAQISIEDNGVGIAEQVQESVFGMFVKGSTQSKGTGLGLYMVRLACEKIRAKVDLQSSETDGSQLHFNIPNLVGQSAVEN